MDIYEAMERSLGVTMEILGQKLAERRLVPLRGKLDKDMANGICGTLVALDLKEAAPITLLISSNGGDVPSGKYIGDIIQTLRSPVDGLVIDRAASMAVDVLLTCRKRRALPHAEIYVHFTRCGFEVVRDSEAISDIDIAALTKKLTDDKRDREDLYMARLGKTRDQVHELFRLGEKYSLDYSADQALKLGFIDEIDRTFKFFAQTEKIS